MLTSKLFTKGTVIFREGQWEPSFYDIRSGKVGIYAGYGTDKEHLLTELEAGRYFGEMGLIEAMSRSATAVALEDTETVVIDSESFRSYFENEPEKVVQIMKSLCARLRELSDQYDDACNTMREYVTAEAAKKPGLLARLRQYCEDAAAYAALADAVDPTHHLYYTDHNFWF